MSGGEVIDASARFFERMMARDPHVDAAVAVRVERAAEAAALTDEDMAALREIATSAWGDAKYIVATRRLLAASALAAERLLAQQDEIEALNARVLALGKDNVELRESFGRASDSAVASNRRALALAEVARTAIGIVHDVEKAVASDLHSGRAADLEFELDRAIHR